MTSFFAGIGLGLSLIIAIGAQNVYVLRQGIRRQHVLLVVLVCALSDAALILAGTAGLGFMLERIPWLVDVARWAGALFLLGYGVLALRRAWIGDEKGLDADSGTDATRRTGRAAAVGTVLALTWFNPHVYLDTVLLLGSVAATHGEDRWLFAAGAVLASILWFTALGYGARLLAGVLATPRAWRALDFGVAIIMFVIAASLVWPVLAG